MDGSGDIDSYEFEMMMADLCIPLSREALAAEFAGIDKDGSGEIDFMEVKLIAWCRPCTAAPTAVATTGQASAGPAAPTAIPHGRHMGATCSAS